jgi:hypothetical protein
LLLGFGADGDGEIGQLVNDGEDDVQRVVAGDFAAADRFEHRVADLHLRLQLPQF